MRIKNRTQSSSKNGTILKMSNDHRYSRKRSLLAIAIALYVTFLLLSTIAFTADRLVETNMKDNYNYNLRFPTDGYQSHYYVERLNVSKVGKIDIKYTTSTNILNVDTENIKVLRIDCRSLYEDECKKVFGFDPTENSNYYKWYFIEKNHLNVNVDTDCAINELVFIDTPIPSTVLVDGITWVEDIDYKYTNFFSTVLSNVPEGISNIDIYFKSATGTPPMAALDTSKTLVSVNETVTFDASASKDTDGKIISYIFDFGDGNFRSGSYQNHNYPTPGAYCVVLTVRDNDYLIDHEYVNITVVESTNIPKIQGIVPDQEKVEDSPPWTLDLEPFKPIARTPGTTFYWYLTGENRTLYTVLGENGTEDKLIFKPLPDAYGSDLVKLWLSNNDGVAVNQNLWINITAVNDPPIINNLPDLIVHYDDPYTFDYGPYIMDKETPNDGLILTIFDGYIENYITIDGLSATFNYPQSIIGDIIYATITVSDSINKTQQVISIGVTSDYVPKLIKKLPDVILYEGTIKYNAFDLDEYFTDPDDDSIFFSYGYTHLNININSDHSVDISADSEWTGSELVTFRARDPIGALAEDTIIVIVLPVNDPPIINNLPDFFIRFNHDYRFDLTPYIYDNDNLTEELRIIVSDLEHIRLDTRNRLIILMNYPEEYLGRRETVRITVTDGLASAFDEISVTITDDFPPELINPIPDIVFLEDTKLTNALDMNNYFLDVDGDVLYYTTGNKLINVTIRENQYVDFSAQQNWFGSETMYFRATDPTGALQEDLILVTVLPVNDPPTIKPIPTQTGNESKRWVLNLKDYITDIDDNITELVICTDSDYVVVSGSTLIFLGSPDMPEHVELTVSDGEYIVSTFIDIDLNLKKPPEQLTLWEIMPQLIPYIILIIIIILIIEIVIYRQRSAYDVEEIFLIHKGGILINHLIKHGRANVDDVIFSGMFTAVQDFIQDSFNRKSSEDNTENLTSSGNSDSDNNWILDELKLGNKKIIIEHSENTYLAVIFTGEGSKWLRKRLNKVLGKIESKYSNELPTWDGDVRALAGVKDILKKLINKKENNSKEKIKSKQKIEKPPENNTIYNDNRVFITQNVAKSQSIMQSSNKSRSSSNSAVGTTDDESLEDINSNEIIPLSAQDSAMNEPVVSKPIKIKMPHSKRTFEIDPAKSILQQLAEMEEFETEWP